MVSRDANLSVEDLVSGAAEVGADSSDAEVVSFALCALLDEEAVSVAVLPSVLYGVSWGGATFVF